MRIRIFYSLFFFLSHLYGDRIVISLMHQYRVTHDQESNLVPIYTNHLLLGQNQKGNGKEEGGRITQLELTPLPGL